MNKQFGAVLSSVALLATTSTAQNLPARYQISTLAGGSSRADGIPAQSAYLAGPGPVAVGPDGTVFFDEAFAFVIRKIAQDGTVAPVVGTGLVGHSGDNGPALDAQIGIDIAGLVVDSRSNLYFADTNSTVRKVDANGTVTRFAGTGESGFSGDGGPAPAARIANLNAIALDTQDRLYMATADNRVRRVNLDGSIQTIAGNGQAAHSGDGGPAAAAGLDNPQAVAVDAAGNLYIAEGGYRIRRVSPDGNISTVAGTGTFGFSGENVPAASARLGALRAMAAASGGALYFTEESQNNITTPFSRVRKLTPDGKIVTVAGGRGVGYSESGTVATEARVGLVAGLAVDAQGGLYFSDLREHRIQKVDSAGVLTTIAGMQRFGGDGGAAAKAVLNLPTGIVADSAGNVYVGEAWGLRIRKIDTNGTISTFAGNGEFGDYGDGLPADAASFAWLNQMAFLPDGSLLVADFSNNRVRRIDSTGIITTFAGTGMPGASGEGGAAANAQLTYPFGIAVDTSGAVYISETFGHRIRKVTPDGIIVTIAGNGKPGYSGDSGAARDAQLAAPRSLALDAQGNLYIADSGNFRIRRISPDGTITTVAGNGKPGWTGDGGSATDASIFAPFGLVVDSYGAVLFTDTPGSSRGGVVRRLRPDGTIDTIAGSDSAGAYGDGGDATSAQFDFPDSLAVDASGRILVTDRFNHRVRVLTPAQP